MKQELEHLSARIPTELKRRLKLKAAEMNLNMSRLTVQAIVFYLAVLDAEKVEYEGAMEVEQFMRGD